MSYTEDHTTDTEAPLIDGATLVNEHLVNSLHDERKANDIYVNHT